MASRWLVLTLDPPGPGEEHLLVGALHRLGARSVTREGERVAAWLPLPPDLEDFLVDVRLAVQVGSSGVDPGLEWRLEDAGAMEALRGAPAAPEQVSERIRVVPAAHGRDAPGTTGPPRAEPPPDPAAGPDGPPPDPAAGPDGPPLEPAAGPVGPRPAGSGASLPAGGAPRSTFLLRLVPGLAFGTPEHPTTRSCLRLLDRLLAADHSAQRGGVSGPSILDVGTGSGILAVAAALLGASRVLALDGDPHACDLARENAAVNGVEERVEVREVLADAESLARMGRFDGIVANIEPDGLRPLVPGLARALAPAGWLLLSGVPRGDRRTLLDSARRHGLAVAEETEEEGWWSAVLRHSGH